MKPADKSFPESASLEYCWEILLRAPCGSEAGLTPERMTAAEQMFFLGAPLAHVVEYEKSLRFKRLNGPRVTAARLTRIPIRPRQTFSHEPLAAAG